MGTLKSNLILSLVDKVSGPASGIAGRLRTLDRSIDRLNRSQATMLAPMRGMATRLMAYGAGYIGVTQGIEGTVGAAISFESAMANVRKVMDVSDDHFAQMRRDIIGLSREMPITANGFAEIYAAAGASDVPTNELGKFAKMVAQVSTAWEIPVAETGQALAEIKNQLHLSIDETGLFADALNHLDNNSAARSRNLLDYANRVAGTGELYGFAATQTLAFGGAMIASGAEAEVAATSFRNMGRALTIGSRATKMQRTAFKRLGLDSVKTAKGMQKNALNTTLEVIDKIQALPEWERVSIASALFGDEARALMPVINNASELRRQLGLIGDQANYAGSAFQEYVKRADTTGNVLAVLRNKIADSFRGWGDEMLPSIKEAALGIGSVLDTLGERAGVFDEIGAGIRGFAQGLGFEGGIREAVEGLGDLLFGEADGSAAADRLGEIFMRAKGWGESLRSLNDAIAASPLSGFLKSVGGYGMQLAAASIGLAMFAGAVRTLAGALYLLSGAKAAVGILKWLAKFRWPKLPTFEPPTTSPKPSGAPKPSRAPRARTFGERLGRWGGNLKRFARGGIAGAVAESIGEELIDEGFRQFGYDPVADRERWDEQYGGFANWWRSMRGLAPQQTETLVPTGEWRAPAYEPPRTRGGVSDVRPMPSGPVPDVLGALRGVTITTQQQGVADVHVTNEPALPPPLNLAITVEAGSAGNPQAVGDATAAAVLDALRASGWGFGAQGGQ